MTEADRVEFVTLLRGLAETLSKTLTGGQIVGYWEALKDLPIADLRIGFGRALKTAGQFLPVPAEIRAMSGEIPISSRAALAWEAVKRAVHEITAYGSVQFDDPTTNAAVRNLGGWVDLCSSDADEFNTWRRKEFERVYAVLAAGHITEDQARPLLGMHGFAPDGLFLTGLPPLPGTSKLIAEARSKQTARLAGSAR